MPLVCLLPLSQIYVVALVLDQERLCKEVLCRWFKHQKFASFQRQLNNYGFSKIRDLRQGVFRPGNEKETCHYQHPHFIRGQPDLLGFIENKRHVEPSSQKQLLDISPIVNGIQSITLHQKAITTELDELKASNQHVREEAVAARERQKKHEDTTDRIVKFLAGVFGNSQQISVDDNGHTTSHAPENPQRLMIGDGESVAMGDADGANEQPVQSPEWTGTCMP